MKSKKTKRIDVLKKRAQIAATWRSRRNLTGLDGKSFARKHGFIESNLTRWESGETIPGDDMVEQMEECLKKEGV